MIIVPTAEFLKNVHDVLIQERGERGYVTEGLVDGCIKRAITYVYEYEPFPDIFDKAAALLYCIIVFHPFVDGNKRTALWGTALMLIANGYLFESLPPDSVEFCKAIAEGKVDNAKIIAEWLRSYSKRTLRSRLTKFILVGILYLGRYRRFRNQERVRMATAIFHLIED